MQEAIWFNIVPPLVIQDLTKYLEEFNWESFEVWVDFISSTLIACQDRELCDGTPLERAQNRRPFLSPTLKAFKQRILPSHRPKKKGEPILPMAKVTSLMRSQGVADGDQMLRATAIQGDFNDIHDRMITTASGAPIFPSLLGHDDSARGALSFLPNDFKLTS